MCHGHYGSNKGKFFGVSELRVSRFHSLTRQQKPARVSIILSSLSTDTLRMQVLTMKDAQNPERQTRRTGWRRWWRIIVPRLRSSNSRVRKPIIHAKCLQVCLYVGIENCINHHKPVELNSFSSSLSFSFQHQFYPQDAHWPTSRSDQRFTSPIATTKDMSDF